MTSRAKAKGNSWERELCEVLKKNFGGNWQRVPNSGAFTGGANTFRKDFLDASQIRLFKGDIIPAEHMPKIVLECKFYKDFPFHSLVREQIPQLDDWIGQTKISADDGDTWFLCIKINRRGTFIVFDSAIMNHFVLDNFVRYKQYVFTDLNSFVQKNKDSILKMCS